MYECTLHAFTRDACASWPDDGLTPVQHKVLGVMSTKSKKIAVCSILMIMSSYFRLM